ncbi:MAG: DUF5615 family PIN-like protein [Deltaproteobacteria bacterium]|nr:DUF5615 family PIN-like protein [Deltaproteobacteria bacterium]
MKFLLNMNMPTRIAPALEARGYPVRHVRDIGLARATDRTILETARSAGETIVTMDLDYGQLLAFSGDAKPSVLILRIPRVSPDRLLSRLMEAIPKVAESLDGGAIVIVEENTCRVRTLPFARESG